MEYRVLARKYRPAVFADLIGQDVLVRTLSNAVKSGRIAHAFLLTGIRGVGKTTTARIIARVLTCVGADGQGGPTAEPCGVCAHCRMIAEDRHVDVLEMDAASRTGVSDIRELIDGVKYLPSAARYKVYIIDEVHMLSGSAFNALLKTLEEPPPHVKFVFATTEARKIPVTILSRCQRFDLARVEAKTLSAHLAGIAQKERVRIDEEALELIALAAEGSVRDSLSLLDQAIAHAAGADDAAITGATVRQMIGMTDRSHGFDLLLALLSGDIAAALAQVRGAYLSGADPVQLTHDLLDLTHLVTRIQCAPQAALDISLCEEERTRATQLAGQLSLAALARLWQMLLKGVGELKLAPSPVAALEMLMIRIAYAATLPTPDKVIRALREERAVKTETAAGMREAAAMPYAAPLTQGSLAMAREPAPVANSQARPRLELVASNVPTLEINDFAQAVALFEQYREPLLYVHLTHDARLVSFTQGQIELRMTADMPRDFAARVSDCLTKWTGNPWKVVLSRLEGAPSLHEQAAARRISRVETAQGNPLVQAVLAQFPGAKVADVKETKGDGG